MNILEMFADCCRRNPKTLTIENLVDLAKSNQILIEDDCFIIFAVAVDEVRMLQPYAAKGKKIRPLGEKLEQLAKEKGYKKISIISDRPAAYERLYPDYKPVATLFEKGLI